MRVLEEREKKRLNSVRKNTELLIIRPPTSLFKVVVNNYRQQEKPFEQSEEDVETMAGDPQGLPPQPAGYLKFPEFDWF